MTFSCLSKRFHNYADGEILSASSTNIDDLEIHTEAATRNVL